MDLMATKSIEALGFATAAALCAMLLQMHWRVSIEVSRGYAWFWLTGFVYATAAFAATCISLADAGMPSTALSVATSLAWSSTCFGPLIFAGFVEPHVQPMRARRAIRVLAYVAVLGLVVRFTAVAIETRFDVGESDLPAQSFYVSLLFAAICLGFALANRRHASAGTAAAERRTRWFAPVATILGAVQTIATLTAIHGFAGSGLTRSVFALISSLWVLPWTIVLAFFFAQTRFADVALKRTLMLIVSVAVAAVFAWSIPGSIGDLAFIVVTLGAATLMLAAPILYRVLIWCIDRVLLRRPKYKKLERLFADSARHTAGSRELLATAAQCLGDTLQANAHFVRTELAAAAGPTRLATIQVGAQYSLLIEDRVGARTLMQEEFSFLEAMAGQVAHRLESLQLEAERRELQLNEERLHRSVTEAELKALRAQVDPHFLFNTLNAIADLISRDPDKAEAMIERLAECFRYALSRQKAVMSTLDDELQFIRRYLDIEQVRFGSRLRVELYSQTSLSQSKIPSLILQPLVENAVRHGLSPKPEGGCVRVSASLRGERLQLEVCDDGVGMKPPDPHRVGVGLKNVRERLQLLYRDQADMTISSGTLGAGTLITLLLPAT